MIHQPWGLPGQASDIESCKESCSSSKTHSMLAHHTGQSIERIERDTDRDNFLSAEARELVWSTRC